jgi:hypothetical protein
MTPEEKQISFYNRYFIFRKNRNINAKQLKSSFLSYAGLQEEQDRAAEGEDEGSASIALEKIAKASRPIDVASKPAIAAHILEQRKTEKQLAELSGEPAAGGVAASSVKASTMKIKPKPKKASGAATTAKVSASAAAAVDESPSAPIEQIEKKIQKRTKKAKPATGDEGTGEGGGAAAEAAAPSAPPVKPKRQTKKKTDL